MEWQRRQILGAAAVLGRIAWAAPEETKPMYGLIVKMVAAAGQREELISLLLQGTDAMPGCLSYVIAKDSPMTPASGSPRSGRIRRVTTLRSPCRLFRKPLQRPAR